jgi:hypothetical protein
MDGLCVRHSKQSCSVCLEPVSSLNTTKTKRLTCGHAFHVPCIMKWFLQSDECPSCRTKQVDDPLLEYKKSVETMMREKYIEPLERELFLLRRGTLTKEEETDWMNLLNDEQAFRTLMIDMTPEEIQELENLRRIALDPMSAVLR